jgi:hypothetical protein
MPTVVGFVFDDENEEKIGRHGLVSDDLLAVLEGPHVVRRNRKHRPASYILVGRDHHGRCLAIPIEAAYDPLLWRPVTAWVCKASEEDWCP